MEPVEFREIAMILAVGEELSFTRAAEKNYISQPALSKIARRTALHRVLPPPRTGAERAREILRKPAPSKEG